MSDNAPAIPAVVRRVLDGLPDAQDQLQAFQSLSTSRKGMVERRLIALEAYWRAGDRTKDGAAAAAEQAGLKLRAFYKLLSEVSRLGPVIGSTPYARRSAERKVRRAPIRDGFGTEAEDEIRRALAEDPNIPFLKIQSRIVRAFEAAGKKPPSPNTIRRRLQNVRGAVGRYLVAGREMMIVQEETSRFEGVGVEVERQTATIILDMDTRLVVALSIAPNANLSLSAALTKSGCLKVEALSRAGVPFLKNPSNIVLALPECDLSRLMVQWGVSHGKSFSLERRDLSSKDLSQILEPIFGRADMPEDPHRVLLTKLMRLNMLADTWNGRIVAGDKRRARDDVDDGQGLIRAMASLADALRPIRVAV